MIRILHVISDKNIGGAGILLLNQLSATDKKLFEYSVALPIGSMLVPRIRKLGVKVFETELTITKLIKIINSIRPHIVHTHASAYARIAARICRVKKTVNTRHCAPDSHPSVSLLRKTANRVFDKLFTDKTVATANYVRTHLISEGISAKKIWVIINGSTPKKFFNKAERTEARKKWGYCEDDLIVAIIGRLEKGKGQEFFIEAAKICSDCEKIKFVIVGDGSMKNELKKRANRLENLRFTGFIDDVSEIMNIIDVNVNLSYISETSSLSLSEGMSVGAVPVVSDCGGNGFIAKECGIVISKKDGQALAKVLKELSHDRPRLTELSQKARERFFKEFTAEAMTKQLEAIYSELVL